MQERSVYSLVCLVALLVTLSLPSCGGGGGGGGGGIDTTAPTYISVIWPAGTSTPTDRTDVEATSFIGEMCPARALRFRNHDDQFAGLTIINDCSLSITLALCVAKGSLPQPDGGLEECATDPFDTPATDLRYHTINALPGGGAEDYRNTTDGLSLVVFFCSNSQTLCAPPVCDQVSCL